LAIGRGRELRACTKKTKKKRQAKNVWCDWLLGLND